jgi:cytochrome c oxidase cbb3-type subunit III
MPTKIEKDALTGKETTGHDWDGVRELNTPLPKWWLYTWLASIAVGIGYFILMPAIPLLHSHSTGLLGYSTRARLAGELDRVASERAPVMNQIRALPIDEIPKHQDLVEFAMIKGKATFADNCTPCHGAAGSGRTGYPNLQDDVWLWGGKLSDIQQTITFGVRSNHPQARSADMPHFGADAILKPNEVQAVSDFVWALYGGRPKEGTEAGAKIFADNCAVCHGDKGEGNPQVGAPPLATQSHLYEGTREAIVRQVTSPRQGVMPAWTYRFDDPTIKSLALYVHSLGGGQ